MEWILVGSALWAASMPAHDDWLNDLSLMPPMSVTMHALNLAAVVCVFGAGLAQPATTSASTLSAAAALTIPLTIPPLRRPCCRRFHRHVDRPPPAKALENPTESPQG